MGIQIPIIIAIIKSRCHRFSSSGVWGSREIINSWRSTLKQQYRNSGEQVNHRESEINFGEKRECNKD